MAWSVSCNCKDADGRVFLAIDCGLRAGSVLPLGLCGDVLRPRQWPEVHLLAGVSMAGLHQDGSVGDGHIEQVNFAV